MFTLLLMALAAGPLADAVDRGISESLARERAAALTAVRYDLAFIVPKDVAAGDLVKAAQNADKGLVRLVTVFDVFEGGSLAAEGKKSIAIEVTIQPTTETLTDQAIETITQKIVADVKRATGGELRS